MNDTDGALLMNALLTASINNENEVADEMVSQLTDEEQHILIECLVTSVISILGLYATAVGWTVADLLKEFGLVASRGEEERS